jgi:hypothetical protein
MELLTNKIIEDFKKYPFGSQDNKKGMARKVLVKFFNPYGVGTWIITEAEWQEALQKDLFYNVSVNYASCRYDEGSRKTDESTTLLKYDGEKMSGNGKVKENVAKTDMSTDEVVNILSYGKDGFAESEFDAENGQYFVMAYNGYYEMQVGLIYRFTDGKLVHFEFHFLEDGTKDGMYRSNWLVFDFYDYGVTQID